MEAAQKCHRNIVIDGKLYRTLSDRCWDTAGRLADMDQTGVSLQAISPMPELFSYWMDTAAANELLRFINEQIAEFVAQSRGRMVGLGAVPLQDLDLAVEELRRVRLELNFAGVEVGSNVNGTPIGAPEFDPFFAAAEALEAAVFVHAVRPTGMDRLVGPKPLQQVLAYPTDVGLAAAAVICSNVILRFPRLRMCFSHGGGTLAALLPRLERGRDVFAPLGQAIHESPTVQARRLYYDSLVFDELTLAHLANLFGVTQLMVGTDYPFAFRERRPVKRIRNAFADADIQTKLLSGNARQFLNLAEDPS
jgi:aminocarboxymuconate-semialdehyde decarboxylase